MTNRSRVVAAAVATLAVVSTRAILAAFPTSAGALADAALAAARDRPWLYYGPAALAVAALAGLSAIEVAGRTEHDASRSRGEGTPRSLVRHPRLFEALVVVAVLALRWPSFGGPELNVDESFEISEARKLLVDPVYWRAADGTTHGPLVEVAIMLPAVFGLPIDWASSRLVGALLVAVVALSTLGLLRRAFGEGAARAGATFVTILAASTKAGDLLAYNGEYPTAALIAAGAWLAVAALSRDPAERDGRLVAAGIILGAVPFSKQQGAPIALAVAGMALAALVMELRRSPVEIASACRRLTRSAAPLALGLALPTLFVLAFVLASGTLEYFVNAYIRMPLDYADRDGRTLLEKLDSFLAWTELRGKRLVPTAVLAAAGAAFVAVRWRGLSSCARALTAGVVATGLAALYAVIRSGKPYPHYLILAAPSVLVGLGACVAAAVEAARGRRARVVAVALPVALAALALAHYERGRSSLWSRSMPPGVEAVAATVRAHAREGDRLIVWGWNAKLYVLTGLLPGARQPETIWAMDRSSRLQPYFYGVFLDDWRMVPPEVFVDAVGPTAWVWNDRATYGHERYPEVAALVERDYALVADHIGDRVYVRRAKVQGAAGGAEGER